MVASITALSFLLGSVASAAPTHVPAPKGNWIERLPPAQKSSWLCVLWHESRSTLASLNLTDNNRYGSSGIFQIEQGMWAAHQLSVHVPLRIHVWQANVVQQFAVAHAIFLADGFSPWRADSACF